MIKLINYDILYIFLNNKYTFRILQYTSHNCGAQWGNRGTVFSRRGLDMKTFHSWPGWRINDGESIDQKEGSSVNINQNLNTGISLIFKIF